MSYADEIVAIARCPEHGLHGERSECFVCAGDVEQVEMVPTTWAGLMAILDAWYPAEVFDGSSGDVGCVIVALLRERDELRKTIHGAVALWDEAHVADDPIALGAAVHGLNAALAKLNSWQLNSQDLAQFGQPDRSSEGS